MGGLPCAKVILDQLAYLRAAVECTEQGVWLRTHPDAPELTDAERDSVKELLKQADEQIKKAGKIISKPFEY